MADSEQAGLVKNEPMEAPGNRPGEDLPYSKAFLLNRASFRLRMGVINGIFALAIIAFTVITHYALRVQLGATDDLIRLNEAEQYAEDADRLHDSLRGDLYAALLAPHNVTSEAQEFIGVWQAEVTRFREDLELQSQLALPQAVLEYVDNTREHAEEFLVRTQDLLTSASSAQAEVASQLPDFEARFEELASTFEGLNTLLGDEIGVAKLRAADVRDTADDWILTAAVSIIACSVLLALTITRSVSKSVDRVSSVASALASGELDVRYEQTTADEIGSIGASLNVMAANLQETLQKLRSDSERDRFGKQLAEALEIADTERDIGAVAARAMGEISSARPMELMLAESAQTTLERVAESVDAGSPGCLVETPGKCVAVRRGNSMRYADSRQLNACPYLQDRAAGPSSAVCVPLSFMGSSLGVLHATAPTDMPLEDRQVADLETLAVHLGNRIGTVRAFRQTQNQALTDSMTGLANRRALEAHVAEMLGRSGPFGLVMADLDHFKRLNDELGHQAGDRALRLFSDAVRSCMRAADLAARWGGEEFVIVLSGAAAPQAVEWTERLRGQLAAKCVERGVPAFTASFGVADSSMWPELRGLLQIADAALYLSKKAGRDRVTLGTADTALIECQEDAVTDGFTSLGRG